jgi:pyruvate/2-oxoglutarate dehydrogenase complex dihydrolipoamide dehydrogenase (E3) component
VWADSLEGIEIAQAIARLGETVTLLTPHQVLVPAASLAVNQVLQASLEAHGVAIWTSQSIQSVAKVGDELHIQGSDRPFDAQELIVTGSYQPQLDGYNLEAVGLSPTGLDVDPHGRTRHPRVYACLGLHAGEPNPSLARNQAEQAIAHGLGWPIPRPKPMPALHILRTDPELAYGGMSEAAIHLRYGSKVHCLRYPFKQLAIAHFWNQTTGFCQLWVHPQGYILRVEIVGLQAADLAGIVAIAIHQRLPISTLGRLPTLPTMAQSLFSQIALTWQQQWGDRHPQWRDWLESWLIWQRDWSR